MTQLYMYGHSGLRSGISRLPNAVTVFYSSIMILTMTALGNDLDKA